ncbi:MAG: NAD(P)-binding protein [Rubrivivax sp.]|nr:NAD(P)-binding protein [Rubrivivax sp.]
MTPEIAIVGAGLAGLACAHRLAAAGVAVTVFEKSRGAGGRCATRRSEVGPFHHGAPSFNARSAAFRAEVARWQAAGWVRPGAAPGSWVGWPTMNTLARQMAAGLHLVTEATVTALVPDADAAGAEQAAWRLQFAEAGVAPAGGFAAVVVAAPAEQAVVLTRASVLLQAQLQAVHSEPCWTLMLAWPPGAAPAALPALPVGSPLAALVDCSALPQASGAETPAPVAGTRWTLHARADWSRVHLEDPPAQAAEAMLQALSAAFPAPHPLPPPTHTVAHRWRYAQVTAPAAAPFGWDAALRLGCCGDAWQGAAAAAGEPLSDGIERAWLSGVGVAEALLLALAPPAVPAR